MPRVRVRVRQAFPLSGRCADTLPAALHQYAYADRLDTGGETQGWTRLFYDMIDYSCLNGWVRLAPIGAPNGPHPSAPRG